LNSIIFPDASVDMVFKQRGSQMQILLCGVMNKPMTVRHKKGDRYYGVRFKPGYAWAYFDTAIDTTLNQKVILPHYFKQQQDIIEHLKNDAPSLSSFSQFIQMQLLQKVDMNKLKTLDAQAKILNDTANADVSSLAASLHLSRRHFSRCFKTMYGISPRDYSNIKRLNALRSLHSKLQDISLAEVALLLGYADQAHMNHSLKKLTGLTPKVLMSQSYNT